MALLVQYIMQTWTHMHINTYDEFSMMYFFCRLTNLLGSIPNGKQILQFKGTSLTVCLNICAEGSSSVLRVNMFNM